MISCIVCKENARRVKGKESVIRKGVRAMGRPRKYETVEELEEIIEEYGMSGEEFVLQKRKTSTKTYPPDLSALQLLLEEKEVENKYQNFSNDELEKEKLRLIKLLKEEKWN